MYHRSIRKKFIITQYQCITAANMIPVLFVQYHRRTYHTVPNVSSNISTCLCSC